MLDELQKDRRHEASDALSPLKNHAAVGSILNGLTDSRVFVDNRDHPRCSLTWTKSRIYLSGKLSGEAAQRAAETIRNKIEHDSKRRGARNYYELDVGTREWSEVGIDGYRLEVIDRRFLDSSYENLDKVREEMCSERGSVEEFLEKSVGVCGVAGDEVASWCMSEYNHGDRYEIGIATAEKHRRQGLATATADALMRLCLGRGFSRVGWHCWNRNTPSNRTAQGLGFTLVESYPVFFLEAES